MCRFVQEAFQFAAGPGSLDEVDRAASRRERPSTTTTPSPNRTESPRKSRHPAGQNPPSTRPQAATDRGRRTERRNLDEHGRDQPGHRRRQEDQRTQNGTRSPTPRPSVGRHRRNHIRARHHPGEILLDEPTAAHPSVSNVWAGGGRRNSVLNHGTRLGINVEAVQRPGTKGIEPLPKRRAIKQTPG